MLDMLGKKAKLFATGWMATYFIRGIFEVEGPERGMDNLRQTTWRSKSEEAV